MPSSLACLLEGLIVYLGGGFLAIKCRHLLLDIIIMYTFIVLLVQRYAPAQTKKRLIADVNKPIFKEMSIRACMFWTGLAGIMHIISIFITQTVWIIRLDALAFSLMLGMVVQAVHLLPFMFTLFER